MSSIDSFAMAHATLRASLLIKTAGFPRDSFDDARQDLLYDYWRRVPKFDPARGDAKGFARGVMRHRAMDLVGRRARSSAREVLIADLQRTHESAADMADLFDNHNPTDALIIAMDVRDILSRQSAQIQLLASLLPHSRIDEICAATGKSRTWVYIAIQHLRGEFAGLRVRGHRSDIAPGARDTDSGAGRAQATGRPCEVSG